MWLIFALLSGFCAALLAIVVKLHLKHLNPILLAFMFAIIMALILIGINCFTKKLDSCSFTSLTQKEWLYIIIAGCLNGLSFTAYLTALNCGKTCNVVAIDRLGILYVVILSVIFLQESFTVWSVVGALMMVLGASFLST